MAGGSDADLTFFNPWEEIEKSRNHLPHWQQPGATYFITFRLADSVPAPLRAELAEAKAAWLAQHPPDRNTWDEATLAEYHQRFSAAVERWLDAGHGSCLFRDPAPRKLISNALRHFDGDRYVLHSAVVMPNHVHGLMSLHGDGEHPLQGVLHSWKSFTAHEIAKRWPARAPKPLWQEDYFDRLVRDACHFANCVRYIRRNPQKAGLPADQFELYESPIARSLE